MRDGECRDLGEQCAPSRAEKEDAQDEENVIESLGDDVGEAETQIHPCGLPARECSESLSQGEGAALGVAFDPLPLGPWRGLVLKCQEIRCVGKRVTPSEGPRAARDRSFKAQDAGDVRQRDVVKRGCHLHSVEAKLDLLQDERRLRGYACGECAGPCRRGSRFARKDIESLEQRLGVDENVDAIHPITRERAVDACRTHFVRVQCGRKHQ